MTPDALPGAPLDAAHLIDVERVLDACSAEDRRTWWYGHLRDFSGALRAAWAARDTALTDCVALVERLTAVETDLDAALRQRDEARAEAAEWRRVAHGWDAIHDNIVAGADAAVAERDELRAVLAPLLDHPFEPFGADNPFVRCRVCVTDSLDGWTTHSPICPVRRRDELLGRLDDAAPGAARPPNEGATT